MRWAAPASACTSRSRACGRTTSCAAATSGGCNFADLQARFPAQLGDVDAEAFYRAVTHTEPGLIRVEADELTYDLHVMLRVELECALMDGSLDVAACPACGTTPSAATWASRCPTTPLGVLQDIHWSTGYVGSFPSYTIGNVTAAQLMDSLRRDDAGLDGAIAEGDYAVLADKLRTGSGSTGGASRATRC
jgi:carboxypeptidase Taq